jgi:hypothetical protein
MMCLDQILHIESENIVKNHKASTFLTIRIVTLYHYCLEEISGAQCYNDEHAQTQSSSSNLNGARGWWECLISLGLA